MTPALKALSALLCYPTAELQAAAAELPAALAADGLLPGRERRRLQALVDELARGDLIELQERYVLLFDRTRSLSLHLFEHVHGESRDRGQAMVDLAQLYARHGLSIEAAELPDYLPLFLEFASQLEPAAARAQLAQPAHILAALAERLRRRRSAYASVFEALTALAARPADRAGIDGLLQGPDDDPEDLRALDAAWAEEPVRFGPSDGGCGKAQDILARIGAATAPRAS